MNSLDFLLPAKNAGPASDLNAPDLHNSDSSSAEPFDQMMNRALNKPLREPAEKPLPVKKAPGHPVAVRKQPTSLRAESDSAPTANSADPAVRDNSAAKSEENSAGDDGKPDSEKKDSETGGQASASGVDNSTPLQILAATLAPEPIAAPTPVVFKTANGGAEISPLAAAGTESKAGNLAAAETANATATAAQPDIAALKPAPKETAGAGKKILVADTDPAKKSASTEGAVAVQTLLEKNGAVNETPVNTADSASTKPHAPTTELGGTSAAEQTATMNNAEPAAKVAGTPESSVPAVTALASAVQAVTRSKPAVKASARVESSDASAPTNPMSASRPPSAEETSSTNLISASSQTELRARALDRTHDILALHGMQLKQSNTDSLNVVIKPGAGLQLSLQMKQTGDGIQAQAVLQQGNFNELNKHWAELQQRLEERGIRLAPLGNESAAANNGGENFQQQSRQPGQPDALSAGAFAEFAAAGASSPNATLAATVASRGWESWA